MLLLDRFVLLAIVQDLLHENAIVLLLARVLDLEPLFLLFEPTVLLIKRLGTVCHYLEVLLKRLFSRERIFIALFLLV